MAETTAWYFGNEPGHLKALVGDALQMSKIIGRSSRIMLVTGPKLAEEGGAPAIQVVRSVPHTTLVMSPKTRPFAAGEDVHPDVYMNVLEVMDRVRDPYWKGFDGGGRYDLIIFVGMDYYFASQMFSLIKHFGHGTKSMSLEPRYQPNASYSFGNLNQELWEEEIGKLPGLLGGDD
jgi:CO dehydrogenase/acetyl-CoA synthase complex epsilon subunit